MSDSTFACGISAIVKKAIQWPCHFSTANPKACKHLASKTNLSTGSQKVTGSSPWASSQKQSESPRLANRGDLPEEINFSNHLKGSAA